MYCINLCENGEWREIIIDDYLPCIGNKLAFTK